MVPVHKQLIADNIHAFATHLRSSRINNGYLTAMNASLNQSALKSLPTVSRGVADLMKATKVAGSDDPVLLFFESGSITAMRIAGLRLDSA